MQNYAEIQSISRKRACNQENILMSKQEYGGNGFLSDFF